MSSKKLLLRRISFQLMSNVFKKKKKKKNIKIRLFMMKRKEEIPGKKQLKFDKSAFLCEKMTGQIGEKDRGKVDMYMRKGSVGVSNLFHSSFFMLYLFICVVTRTVH